MSLRVLMWNGCASLVSDSLVLPISSSHYDRIVRELQIPTSTPDRYYNWLYGRASSCTPQLLCTHCCQSSTCCCPVTNHWPRTLPHSSRSSLAFERSGRDMQAGVEESDVRKSDPEVPSSSLSEDDMTFSPAVKLRRKRRPPWKYWRRTGPEPHHRQPGGKHRLN